MEKNAFSLNDNFFFIGFAGWSFPSVLDARFSFGMELISIETLREEDATGVSMVRCVIVFVIDFELPPSREEI